MLVISRYYVLFCEDYSSYEGSPSKLSNPLFSNSGGFTAVFVTLIHYYYITIRKLQPIIGFASRQTAPSLHFATDRASFIRCVLQVRYVAGLRGAPTAKMNVVTLGLDV